MMSGPSVPLSPPEHPEDPLTSPLRAKDAVETMRLRDQGPCLACRAFLGEPIALSSARLCVSCR